jgi:hypothetical protein
MTIHAQRQRLPLNVQRFLANRPWRNVQRFLANRPWRKMSAAAAGVVAVGVVLTVLAASGGISGLVFGAAAAATALAIAGLSRVMVADPSRVTTRDMLPAGQRLKRARIKAARQSLRALARDLDLSPSYTRFTYIGPPAYAGALAQELETRGLLVDYEPPIETKDLVIAMNAVEVLFAVTGPIPAIVSGVRAFKTRFAGTRVEGLLDDESPDVRERLAHLDELKTDGTITANEHAEQRARILREL